MSRRKTLARGLPGVCGQRSELWISGQEAALAADELLEELLVEELLLLLLESDFAVEADLSLLPESELPESDFDESLELLASLVVDADRLSLR